MSKKDQIKEMTQAIEDFRIARDWKQFHNPKDLALSLALEAAEVVEHFQWKTDEEIKKYINENRNDVGDELADVFYWVLLLSHDLDIDIVEAFKRKMKENAEKYPVEKAKGKHDKYTDL
jgi:NTP pyrophosphatase (non-canonical NTP hydrolase)